MTTTSGMADTTSAPLIAVVLVNWNGWRDTLDAVESLRQSDYPHWRPYIVDNASTDGSVEQLRAQVPEAHLIASPTNDGFAGGCNRAIAAALADGADAVFLLNNDAVVRPQTLGALAAASSAHPRAVLGPVVLFKGSGDYQFFGSRTGALTGDPEWFRHASGHDEPRADLILSDFIFGAALFAPARRFTRAPRAGAAALAQVARGGPPLWAAMARALPRLPAIRRRMAAR